MTRRTGLLVLVLAALFVATSLLVMFDLGDIGQRDPLPMPDPTTGTTAVADPPVRIGVVSRFAPNVIYAGYQPIMDYLNRRGSHHYELKLSTSYLDAVDDLRRGEVAASFLGAWIFGRVEADADFIPLAAPLNSQGTSAFQVVLVTRAESTVWTIADLEGARVALPSAQSWSGNWLQRSALPAAGMSVTDLDSLHHFDHHPTVALQVLRGQFDAGVVKESVATEYRDKGLRIALRSEPIPGPPLVACRQGPPDVLAEIRDLLLDLDRADDADRSVLESWTKEFSHGFTAVNREQYLDAFRTKGDDE